jgi:hypothetical protein
MNDKVSTERSRSHTIRKAAMVGAIVGLVYTLLVPAAVCIAPSDVDPLFMVSLYVLVTFPTGIIYRLCGFRWNIESGPQNNSWQIFIAAMLVNSLGFATIFGLIAYTVRRCNSPRERKP